MERSNVSSKRSGSVSDEPNSKKIKNPSPLLNQFLNGLDNKETMEKILEQYQLNYPVDKDVYLKNVYDSESKWYSKNVRPKYFIEDCLPYETESHKEQAEYMAHVLVNLYISISSLDIQGLIPISVKDLANLKDDIDMLNTSNNSEADLAIHSNDIADYDEGEDDEDDEDDEVFEDTEYLEMSGPDFNATGKITSRSSMVINVNYWTNELKNCMHFDFPLSLRKSLAVVFYYLSLVQGQKIFRQLHVEMFELLVAKDDDGTNYTDLLLDQNMNLDHQILLEFLLEFLPYPDSEYAKHDLTSKDDLQLFRLLLKLAHQAKPFFDNSDPKLIKNVMDRLLSVLAPSTMSSVLPMMTSFVPYHYNESCKITDYFPMFFSLWSSVSANVAIDTHMYDFVGSISEDAHWKLLTKKNIFESKITFGSFNLFTESQMAFIFNRLQGHLRTDGQIHSFSRTIKPFIYSINGSNSDKFDELLTNLTKTIETFVHPSNGGFWTKPIAKFVHGFIKMYHKRAKQEETLMKDMETKPKFCLTLKNHSKLVSTFLGLLVIGSQSKSNDTANHYISSFAYLLDLRPENSHVVFDQILMGLYGAFSDENVHMRHRIISSLKQFTRVVRFMVMDKLYRIHVTNILQMLIMKIDVNDISLTSNIINGIVSVASFIPFQLLVKEEEYISFESNTLPLIEQHYYHICGVEMAEAFECDDEILDRAFRASTTIFENIVNEYIQKLFQFISIDLEDGFVTKVNNTTILMQESMDDTVFHQYSKKLQKLFWENDNFGDNNPNYELITIPLSALIKKNPKLSRPIFEDLAFNIRAQTERGAGSIRSTTEIQQRDFRFVYYLTALNDVLRQSHQEILNYKNELLSLFEHIYENITNPPLDVITSILIHSTLTSLTSTEINNSPMYKKNSEIPLEERWGGMQFDERKFSEESSEFDWHVPGQNEIEVAVQMLEQIFVYCKKKCFELMDNAQNDSNLGDKIQKYLLIITHALSGASLLFDSDFDKIWSNNTNDMKNFTRQFFGKEFSEFEVSDLESTPEQKELIVDTPQITSTLNVDEIEQIENIEQTMADHLIMEDDSYSSTMNSTAQTPVPTEFDDSANLNEQKISFKNLDMFYCNYFFGNDPKSKLNNPLYVKVHKIRHDVGLLFHKLYETFSENFENNTMVFQVLLHGLKVWFTDVGQEVIFNDEQIAKLDLEFLENIQSLAHVNEPFTRTCMSVKADAYHQGRVLLHSTTRSPSKLEIRLLKDIIFLASSVYPDISKPAQGALVKCMKQLVGSYSLVIAKILELLEKAIERHDFMQVEIILTVLMIKKFYRKFMSDYSNLNRVVNLLIQCCHINEMDISVFADKILNDIASGIKIPSSVCVIDVRAVNSLAPSDRYLDLKIKQVLIAKRNKREQCQNLIVSVEDNLLELLKDSSDSMWKIHLFVIRLLAKTQANLEIRSRKEVIESLFDKIKSNHPQLVQLSVKALLGIFKKITSLSDYSYDISKAYKSNFDPSFVKTLKTSEENFKASFDKEMNSFYHPYYFIDSRPFVGWLCWGGDMKVVSSSETEMAFEKNEQDIIKTFAGMLSKDFLKNLTNTIIQDNETTSVFSSANVSLFVAAIFLISKNLCQFNMDYLFELCQDLYDRYDKASMITSVEIFASLICGSRFMNKDMQDARNNFVDVFLPDCLENELNHDATEIWGTVCWWLPTVIDLRRCPAVYKILSDMKGLLHANDDAVANQSSKIIMLRNLMMGLEFRVPKNTDLLEKLVFDHPYEQARESISKLFSTIIQNSSNLSLPNASTLLELQSENSNGLGTSIKCMPNNIDLFLKQLFAKIKEEAVTIENMAPQEILKTKFYYMSSTMYHWIKEMARGPNRTLLIPYIVDYAVPFLISLIKHKDLCKLSGMNPAKLYIGLAYMPIPKSFVTDITKLACEPTLMTSSFQRQLQLSLVQHFLSSQLLQLSIDDKKMIKNFVVENLYNEQHVEVRIRAAEVLSDIVHSLSTPESLQALIKQFQNDISKYDWKQRKALSKTSVKIHGSVVGLGAIISAFPYVFPLPPWIPEQLTTLATWARTNGLVGTAAKNTISEFKKVRTDTWQYDRQAFTSEQLEDLEGVLWRSYYA